MWDDVIKIEFPKGIRNPFRKGGKYHVQETAEERPRSCRVRIDSGSGRHCHHRHSFGSWSCNRQRVQPDRQNHLSVSKVSLRMRTTAKPTRLGRRF